MKYDWLMETQIIIHLCKKFGVMLRNYNEMNVQNIFRMIEIELNIMDQEFRSVTNRRQIEYSLYKYGVVMMFGFALLGVSQAIGSLYASQMMLLNNIVLVSAPPFLCIQYYNMRMIPKIGDFEMLFMYSGVAMAIVSRLPLLLKRFTIEVCALLVGKKSQKCISIYEPIFMIYIYICLTRMICIVIILALQLVSKNFNQYKLSQQ